MKKSIRFLTMAAVAAAFVSCDGKKGEGSGSPLTPDENKQKLENVGMEVLGKVNPANHEDFCRAVDRFVECSYGLEVYENGSDAVHYMASLMSTIENVVTKADVAAMSEYAKASSYVYKASDYYAVYECVDQETTEWGETRYIWEKTEVTDRIEFRFSLDDGREVVATAKASGAESRIGFDGDTYMVPEKVEATVALDGKTIASATVTTDCADGDHINVSVTAEASDVSANSNVKLTNTTGTADARLYLGGEEIVSVVTDFGGRGMADIDGVASDDNVKKTFTNAEATVMILNDVKVTATCDNVSDMIGEMDRLYDSYDWYDNPERLEDNPPYYYTQDYWQKYSDVFNRHLNCGLSYSPDFTRVATCYMKPYLRDEKATYSDAYRDENGYIQYEYVECDDYDAEVIVKFDYDSSEYSATSYFSEDSFGSLVSEIERLGNIYEGYFPYCFGY